MTSSITTRTTSRDGSKAFTDEDKVETIFHEIEKLLKIKAKSTFTTQLWFLPYNNNVKINEIIREMLKKNEYFQNFDVMIGNEADKKENPYRHPGPIKEKFAQLISHYQTRAHSHRKKGLIVLLSPKIDIKGIPLPNVDFVFSLNDETDVGLSYLMMSNCMTPKEGKQSVYFVDFNTDRVFNLLKKYFGENINYIIDNKLIRLLDIDEPTLTSIEVKQNIIKKKQDEDVKQEQKDEEEKQVLTGRTNIMSFIQEKKTKPTSRTIPETPQQWRAKALSAPSWFNSLPKLQKLANISNIEYDYEGSTTTGQKKKYLKSLLQQRGSLKPKI